MSSRETPVPCDGSASVRQLTSLWRLTVTAEPDANLLLRLLEPFVIHDVLPGRVDCASDGETLAVTIEFSAKEAVAVRLGQRLSVMVGVRAANLTTADPARMRAA